MNRARTADESYEEYKMTLQMDAKVMKYRLKGRWVWKTFYPIDSMEKLPPRAVVLELNEHGEMVPTKTFDPKNKQHFVKFPPYRASPENKRLTFSQQRKLIHGYDQSTDEEGTIDDDTGGEG